MEAETDGLLLRIYIEEQRKHRGQPLYEWVIGLAQREGLAGATVLRGLEGFGLDHRLHTARVLRLASNLPLILEIVDTPDKVTRFISLLEEGLQAGLLTTQKVRMRIARGED